MTIDFSAETTFAIRNCNGVLKMPKQNKQTKKPNKTANTRIPYLVKVIF